MIRGFVIKQPSGVMHIHMIAGDRFCAFTNSGIYFLEFTHVSLPL
jgi:hypothetical protein